ncbi:MAG: VCBS repeat-containing protein [Planctomycetes bacterium]|nr:VCBS repeat-containing protein [Planctomycetota bacterium]
MTRSVAGPAFMGVLACVIVAALFYVPGLLAPEVTPLFLYRKGVRILYQHRFEDAERTFELLVKKCPDESEAWLALAMAQLNQAEKGVDRAALSLDRAQALRDDDPRIYFCRGLILQYLDDLDGSAMAFRRALELAPDVPDAHYQVAKCLVRERKYEEALPHFEVAVRGDPALAGAWYQLGFIYQRLGRNEEAQLARDTFKALDETGRDHPRGLVFTELGKLAEPNLDWVPPGFVDERAESKARFEAPIVIDGAAPPFAFVDLDLDGSIELWTSGSHPSAWSLRTDPVRLRAIPELTDAYSFAVGDFDVDGRPDLVVSGNTGVQTYRGTPDGFAPEQRFDRFEKAEVRLIDLDLEGDLDLLVTDAQTAPKLLINAHGIGKDGPAATFLSPDDSPLKGLEPRSRLLLARDLDHDGDADLILGNEETVYLVDNGPQWRFVVRPEYRPVRLDRAMAAIVAVDLDGDGWEDLVTAGKSAHGIWWGTGNGQFESESDAHGYFGGYVVVHPVDVDFDGRLDLLVGNALWTKVILNLGGRRFKLASDRLPPAIGIGSGDVDGDGDADIVLETPEGGLTFIRNSTVETRVEKGHALRLYFGGKRDPEDRRTNLHGVGARIDILDGTRRLTRVFDGGQTSSTATGGAQGLQPLVVGTEERSEVTTVLIDWPDGVVQSEGPLTTDELHVIDEVQRKESSCPVLFTWDGERYRFITDFMGGGGLGFWVGMDQYGPPDPTEVVRIEPGALAPIQGVYRLSVMEPMEEIAYVDALSLTAIDHPREIEVYPFEMFATSTMVTPTGEPIAIRRDARVFPTHVRDDRGRDHRDAILSVDRIYAAPSSIDPTLVGYAPRHAFTLTFEELPSEGDLYLFLDGWVEYPYSRINFAASHRHDRLEPPTFRWRRDESEEWQLLVAEVGYPAGMPKTMVLPLGELGRVGAREIRIETNMEIYWDRIFAATRAEVALEIQPLATRRALLRFGGYPKEYSDDGRLPLTYHYDERDAQIPYEPMPGRITRYGDVAPLIDRVDDEFAIVGGGDELWLEFEAPAAPRAGWSRTFFLDTHGYCKDLDPLTAACDAVDPLPFRSMSNYPPTPSDVAPDRSKYVERWNDRRD